MTAKTLSRLPAQLAAFVEAMVETGDGPAAAVAAGVHSQRSKAFSASALDNPEVRAALDMQMRNRLASLVPMALTVVANIARSEKIDPGVRLSAAKTILDRSGYTAQDLRAKAEADLKDLKEMSREELLAALDSTESELADRAKTVGSAPDIGASSLQVIDMEG